MAAAVNDILSAVKTIVEEAFTGKTCHKRRASDKNQELSADMDVASGCFAVHCNEDRPTQMAWAGKKFVKYPVELAYLTVELPGQREPGEAIEDVISAASKLFLICRNESGKPGLKGVPVVNTCEVKPLAPYSLPFGRQTVNASRVRLEFETIEDA